MNKNELPRRGFLAAVAGRRIDADGADLPRLLLANVPVLRKRLVDLLMAEIAAAVVYSAACGADL